VSRPTALARLAALAGGLLGELLSPTRCAACDLGVAADVLFCPPCAASVERADPWLARGGAAAFEYGGALATAIARLKYEDRPDLAPRLGRAMLPAARRLDGAVDLVVPVPLHPHRLARRGYNQAALLALPVAGALGIRLAPRALVRLRDTAQQASLDRQGRLVNTQHAFIARERPLVGGARVLLVDDVRTTGATLEGCAGALIEAGARQVLALVLARRSEPHDTC
jgi:ComF family protein